MGNCCINNSNNDILDENVNNDKIYSENISKEEVNFDIIINKYNANPANPNNPNNTVNIESISHKPDEIINDTIPIEIKPLYNFTRKNCMYKI